ncbi:hypothetical protein [Bradyrhizobium sp. RT9a]|uniref:hypothetical protein n=1 Tax=Bradyrhizobium sp. RT9a TaxID=3156384 RepID=UPI0033987413
MSRQIAQSRNNSVFGEDRGGRGADDRDQSGNETTSAEANLVSIAPLEEAMHANLMQLCGVEFDRSDMEFARRIQSTLSSDHMAGMVCR